MSLLQHSIEIFDLLLIVLTDSFRFLLVKSLISAFYQWADTNYFVGKAPLATGAQQLAAYQQVISLYYKTKGDVTDVSKYVKLIFSMLFFCPKKTSNFL